jgi:hypothetical protein
LDLLFDKKLTEIMLLMISFVILTNFLFLLKYLLFFQFVILEFMDGLKTNGTDIQWMEIR